MSSKNSSQSPRHCLKAFPLQSVQSDNRFRGWKADTQICTDTGQAVTSSALECDPSNQVYRSASRNSWTGVTCNPTGSVICLHLAGLGLHGNADAVAILGDLPDLAYLNLEGNSLSGELLIPPELPWTATFPCLYHTLLHDHMDSLHL